MPLKSVPDLRPKLSNLFRTAHITSATAYRRTPASPYSSRHSNSRNGTSLTASKVAAFALLLFLVNALSRTVVPDDSEVDAISRGLLLGQEHADPKKENLFYAWKTNPETCEQWISTQRSSRAYLDAYIIGGQKTSTSEMSTRLYNLGVLHKFMRKEWQFLNRLRDPDLPPYREVELHRPYRASNISAIRLPHYLAGFPHHSKNVTKDADIPQIDNSPGHLRKVVYDASVEYMLSDRTAFLASLLNPHARIIMSIREPIARALSQYNMLIRIRNENAESLGMKKIAASGEEFDIFVRREMKKLKECGYDPATGNLDRTTSKLLACIFPDNPKDYQRWDKLYVTRGLYHLHIDTWRRFYPDHRMHFIRFVDVAGGDSETMQNVASFLCVRPYPDHLLKEYKEKASNMSYGVQAAKLGLEKWRGFDSYGGLNKYLTEILDSTRKELEEFYAPSNRRLFAMMGKEMY